MIQLKSSHHLMMQPPLQAEWCNWHMEKRPNNPWLLHLISIRKSHKTAPLPQIWEFLVTVSSCIFCLSSTGSTGGMFCGNFPLKCSWQKCLGLSGYIKDPIGPIALFLAAFWDAQVHMLSSVSHTLDYSRLSRLQHHYSSSSSLAWTPNHLKSPEEMGLQGHFTISDTATFFNSILDILKHWDILSVNEWYTVSQTLRYIETHWRYLPSQQDEQTTRTSPS